MEASETVDTINNEQAFKHCGRKGRRGACVSADLNNDKLQDLIQQAGKIALDEQEQSSKTSEEDKAK